MCVTAVCGQQDDVFRCGEIRNSSKKNVDLRTTNSHRAAHDNREVEIQKDMIRLAPLGTQRKRI